MKSSEGHSGLFCSTPLSRYAPAFVLSCLLFGSAAAWAQSNPRTLRVPVDFPTIQGALDAADPNAGDTVLVDPGTYTEAVKFGTKTVRLVSAAGPSVTSIIAPTGQVAVSFGEGPTKAVLSGFTISNGVAGISVTSGGALGTTPTITSNVIVN